MKKLSKVALAETQITHRLYNFAQKFGQVVLYCKLWLSHTIGTTFWIQNFTAGFISKMGAYTNESDSHFLTATQLFWKVELYIRCDPDSYVIPT